jgi:lipopolysaccharide/colanic/teichoic acid biosynthesis glycosyltransferase
MNRAIVEVNPGQDVMRSTGISSQLGRLRYQFLLGYIAAVVVPTLLYHVGDPASFYQNSSVNTAIGASIAFVITLYLYRRVITFPGTGLLGYIMPAATAGYGLVLAGYFASRLEYSRLYFGLSFAAAILFMLAIVFVRRNIIAQTFYVVPSGSIEQLFEIPEVSWNVLSTPSLPPDRYGVLIADLRADLGSEWERLIAEAALVGMPVYHVKQVQESLTGRVEIEHLSENGFGSLIPNLSYRKVKRLVDFTVALALLPVLLVPGLLIAFLLKLDSPGPVFFSQPRRGYRGKPFKIVKFRTMTHLEDRQHGSDREAAMTLHRDPRITRIGRLLRRTRIDELPQIINILRGEMSWIGPRPEVMSLSEWYTAELPFYTYRHIVRPGITGWAQVNQGHVADLKSVYAKLHYDFYYIKNFSAWLDILILAKTVTTVFSGNGAK